MAYYIKKFERRFLTHTYEESIVKRYSTEEDAVVGLRHLYEGLVRQFGPRRDIALYSYSGITMAPCIRYIIVKVD